MIIEGSRSSRPKNTRIRNTEHHFIFLFILFFVAVSRTQEQHDIHVTVKLVVFEFVNTFLALFYVGFYLQDLKALR